MTGTEAISNGVSIFRKPQARNARTTLVLMSTILGVMFLGVSVLAALTHSVPFVSGTPTVVSEIGTLVYGSSPSIYVLFIGIALFSLGEMLTGPKKTEYFSLIAPFG